MKPMEPQSTVSSKAMHSDGAELKVPGIWTLIWKPASALALFWIGLLIGASFLTQTAPEALSSMPSWQLTEAQWTAVSIGMFAVSGIAATAALVFRIRGIVRSQIKLLQTRLLELTHSDELDTVRVTSHEQLPLEPAFAHLTQRVRQEKKNTVQTEVRTSLVRMASGIGEDLSGPLASLRAFSRSWLTGQATSPKLIEAPLAQLEKLAHELSPQRKNGEPAHVDGETKTELPVEAARSLPLQVLLETLRDRLQEVRGHSELPLSIEIINLDTENAEAMRLAMVEVAAETWMKPFLIGAQSLPIGTDLRIMPRLDEHHRVQVLLISAAEAGESLTSLVPIEPLPILAAIPAPWSMEIPHPQRGEVVVLDPTGAAGELLQRRCENGDFPEITSLYAVASTKELQGLLQEKPSLFERAIFLIEPPIPNERRSATEWAESLGLIRNSAILTRHSFEPRWIEEATAKRMRLIPAAWLERIQVQPSQGLGLSRQIRPDANASTGHAQNESQS